MPDPKFVPHVPNQDKLLADDASPISQGSDGGPSCHSVSSKGGGPLVDQITKQNNPRASPKPSPLDSGRLASAENRHIATARPSFISPTSMVMYQSVANSTCLHQHDVPGAPNGQHHDMRGLGSWAADCSNLTGTVSVVSPVHHER